MKQSVLTFLSIYALVIGAASCSSTSSGPAPIPSPVAPASTAGYIQVERLARPAVKEATESFANHDTTNRVSPQSAATDTTLATSISTFDTTVAGRSAAHAAALVSVLIPDELAADLSKADPKAAYLGVETGGFTGSFFGGRALQDDVIDIDLGAIFGPTLSALNVVPDDGKESYCLVTDNVANGVQSADNLTPTSFPYVGAPH